MRKNKAIPAFPREIQGLTDRERLMAKLARQVGRGHNPIFYGTRYVNENLRTGKLVCPDWGGFTIYMSRSPEIAAYFAYLRGDQPERESRGVLVLNRSSLSNNIRFVPVSEDFFGDNRDEREERIIGRNISFRRHLIGVIRETDVDKILGPLPPDYDSWSRSTKLTFDRKAVKAGDELFREGRARVRRMIIEERARREANGPSSNSNSITAAST